jgi:hypothetical protein
MIVARLGGFATPRTATIMARLSCESAAPAPRPPPASPVPPSRSRSGDGREPRPAGIAARMGTGSPAQPEPQRGWEPGAPPSQSRSADGTESPALAPPPVRSPPTPSPARLLHPARTTRSTRRARGGRAFHDRGGFGARGDTQPPGSWDSALRGGASVTGVAGVRLSQGRVRDRGGSWGFPPVSGPENRHDRGLPELGRAVPRHLGPAWPSSPTRPGATAAGGSWRAASAPGSHGVGVQVRQGGVDGWAGRAEHGDHALG